MDARAELALFYGLIVLTIWGGQWIGVRPPGFVAAVLVVAFCAWSAKRHGDSREALGFDHRHLAAGAWLAARWLGVPLLGLLVWAALPPWPTVERLLYGANGPPASVAGWPLPAVVALGLLRYPLWAFAQEYALLSFCANRWRSLSGDSWRTAFLNGLCFSLVHAPNPILMTFCLAAGIVFTRIFQKAPHLAPLVLAHAAGGLMLSVIFRDFYPAMMVGPAYLRYAGSLFGR